jgi:hypothetical protein
MPSFTEVPRNSLVACLSLAGAVHQLGGIAHNDEVTNLLQRKSGGAWRYLVNSAVQHGLVTYSNWLFRLAPLYTGIISSKDAEEERGALQKAFLYPNIYKRILSEFESPSFDIERYLIEKEDFDMSSAVIVSRNFIDGAKYVGLLPGVSKSSNSLFIDASNQTSLVEDMEPEKLVEDAKSITVDQGQTRDTVDSQHLIKLSSLSLPHTKTSVSIASGPVEKRVIQIPLPNNRVAELTIPSDLSTKDMTIISMQMEVLKAYADNN